MAVKPGLHPVQRADVFRYLVLWHQGGYYADTRARQGLGWVNGSEHTAIEPWCHTFIARNHPQMASFAVDYDNL